MVSKLYEAGTFYRKQKEGKLATTLDKKNKLHKDTNGFYLYKNTPSGKQFKQRVNQSDYVYSRQEGVTKFSEKRDRNNRDVKTLQRATAEEHKPYRHIGDRKAKSTGKRYWV